LAAADVAAVCSGTATLEAALLTTAYGDRFYKTFVAQLAHAGSLITIAHYVSGEPKLPDGGVATELIQDEFTAETLSRGLISLLSSLKEKRSDAKRIF